MLNPLDAGLLSILHHLIEHSPGYSPENRAAAHAQVDEHFGVEAPQPEPEPAAAEADAEQGPAEPDPRDAEIAELKAQLAAATEGK